MCVWGATKISSKNLTKLWGEDGDYFSAVTFGQDEVKLSVARCASCLEVTSGRPLTESDSQRTAGHSPYTVTTWGEAVGPLNLKKRPRTQMVLSTPWFCTDKALSKSICQPVMMSYMWHAGGRPIVHDHGSKHFIETIFIVKSMPANFHMGIEHMCTTLVIYLNYLLVNIIFGTFNLIFGLSDIVLI